MIVLQYWYEWGMCLELRESNPVDIPKEWVLLDLLVPTRPKTVLRIVTQQPLEERSGVLREVRFHIDGLLQTIPEHLSLVPRVERWRPG